MWLPLVPPAHLSEPGSCSGTHCSHSCKWMNPTGTGEKEDDCFFSKPATFHLLLTWSPHLPSAVPAGAWADVTNCYSLALVFFKDLCVFCTVCWAWLKCHQSTRSSMLSLLRGRFKYLWFRVLYFLSTQVIGICQQVTKCSHILFALKCLKDFIESILCVGTWLVKRGFRFYPSDIVSQRMNIDDACINM